MLSRIQSYNPRMVSKALRLAVLLSAIATSPMLAQQTASQLANLRHWSGQGVAPVYEGFDLNPDGSFNMWFGYMNRNYEEEIDLPVGAANTFEPGGDRGQPTHFTTRRHKDVFKVTVPKEFADKTLTWKLTTRGKTEQVIATLKPVWQIDRERTTRGGNSEKISSNLPPVVKVDVASQAGSGATLALSATDDGLPVRRGAPVGLTVFWTKFRGPGSVQFSAPEAKLANGRTTTTATFSEPGDYILQAVVDDGSGESAGNFGYHCCWTNTQVKLTVKGAGDRATNLQSAIRNPRPSPGTSRRFFRKAARPVITRVRRRRCHSSRTTKCAPGHVRSGRAWRTATCRRGISTRPSASATTRTIGR